MEVDTPHLGFSDHWLNLTAVNINAKHIFVATKCTSTSDNYMAIISRGGDRGQLRIEDRNRKILYRDPFLYRFGWWNQELTDFNGRFLRK